jgi:hypothetical protein
MGYKDRRVFLVGLGLILLAGGVFCAFLGPVEVYSFYLFVEGGRFHYEGFGFGSFMFGYIATQTAGYYLIALICIPLGYGHLRLRRWARTLALALLGAWLVVGAPLTILFLLVLFAAKELPLLAGLGIAGLLALSYPLVPWLLIRAYRGQNVRNAFATRDPDPHWLEAWPVPVLVVGILGLFYVVVLHVPLLFNGLFPLFGAWLSGLQGITALSVAIVGLAGLTWGVFARRTWAWWGMLVVFCLLTVSTVVTLSTTTYAGLLSLLNLPPAEMEILGGVPLQGWHLAAFFGLPLILTVVALLVARRHLAPAGQPVPEGAG